LRSIVVIDGIDDLRFQFTTHEYNAIREIFFFFFDNRNKEKSSTLSLISMYGNDA